MADEAAAKLAELSMGGAAPEPATPSRHEEPAGAPGADQAGPAASTDGAKTPSSRADSASRAVHDMRKLFVGGLPQGSTEEAISAVFGPFGEVEEVHMIKPNPSSDSKRGCCFVTYVSAAAAEEAMRALNGRICEPLGTTMPLLVRVADPPRSREEQRSRVAAQQAQQRMPAQVGVLPAWAGALGYGWPAQQPAAFAGAQAGQPFFLAQAGASGSQPTSPQYMGVFPGGYGFGMVPQFPPTQQGEWSEHADTEGNKYYYNSQSGVSQWEPPAHWPTSQAQQLPMMYPYAQALPAGYFAQQANGVAAPLGAVLGTALTGGGMVPLGGAGAGGGGGGGGGKRGPKGANLAVFCIPNSYTDVELHEIARPYGNVVYAQVATHRDSGLSRGYGFVSYENVQDADRAIQAIHGMVVQGRALRVEKVKADANDESGRAR